MMLKDEVVLISGGSRGIGLAAAYEFMREGAKIVITGRDAVRLGSAAEDLHAAGGQVVPICCDQSRLDEIELMVQRVRSTVGKVDVLFANAGYTRLCAFAEVDEAFFDELIGVNLKGTYFLIQGLLPVLSKGSRVIINTSVANRLGVPGNSVYSAAKAGLRSLTRGLAAELAEEGIRVNALSPAFTRTPMYAENGFEAELIDQVVQEQVPLRRWAEADEVARAAVFLASSDASYVHGIELTVDGGLTQV